MAKCPLVALSLATILSCVSAACNPTGSVINTQIKVDPGQSGTSGTNCYFPFSSSGTNNDCIGPYCMSASYCNYWCATSCNYGTDGVWNFCKYTLSDLAAPNCSGLSTAAVSAEPQLFGGSGTGTMCIFPFKYNGVCYYDCINSTTNGDPWCATTDVVTLVNNNYKYCRYTLAGKNHPSCTSIASTAAHYIPPQTGTYSVVGLIQTDQFGNCTFPFYFNGKCYDDCTTQNAQKWYLPWCSTEQYYLPNKKMRFCPYYRKYQTYTGLSLSWGLYRIYLSDGCTTGGTFCNHTLAKATASVPTGSFGSSRMMLSSTSTDVFEVMPQGNGYFLLRLPLPCTANFITVTTDAADVVYDYVATEREFWNILPGTTAGTYTIQSTWNSTAGHYITRSLLSGYQVAVISSSTSSEWRFDMLSAAELASLSLPCENPTNLSSSANVNGDWCAWSSYTVSDTTGTRNRSCNCPAPSGTGATCSGNSTDSGAVVNGTWCTWSAYTVTGTYGTRTRGCNCSAPAYGGGTCSGSSNDTGLVVNATWCSWSSYTVVGAYATRTRTCSCPLDAYGGSSVCPGVGNDTGLVVNGNWCAWSSFTVNGAYGTRTRSCNCSAPDYAGLTCPGINNDTGSVVNGTWCTWSAFTVTGSYATRVRTCNCPVSDYGGSCQGVSNDTGVVTNGDWCAWGAFTVVAGVGTRSRNCSCPDPNYSGSVCSGSSSDVLTQVNGTWCPWSSLASGYGVLTRTRLCNCSAPNAIGVNCTGLENEEYPCNVSSCQTTTPGSVNGAWCAWGSWVAGNVNSGKMSRSRSCGCPAATGSGATCSGTTSETGTCTIEGCMVFYAVPAESGNTGVGFTSSDTFNRLVIWCGVVGGSILISAIVGLALMCRYIATAGSV